MALGGCRRSAEILEKAARAGEANAQYSFARYCIVEVCDEKRGLQYLLRAAKQGHVKAMAQAARIYLEQALPTLQEPSVHDIKKQQTLPLTSEQRHVGKLGLKWLRRCAEEGDILAQFNMGQLYAQGILLSKSFPKAMLWFRRAAEGGSIDAAFNLAICHFEFASHLQRNPEAHSDPDPESDPDHHSRPDPPAEPISLDSSFSLPKENKFQTTRSPQGWHAARPGGNIGSSESPSPHFPPPPERRHDSLPSLNSQAPLEYGENTPANHINTSLQYDEYRIAQTTHASPAWAEASLASSLEAQGLHHMEALARDSMNPVHSLKAAEFLADWLKARGEDLLAVYESHRNCSQKD